MTRGKAEMHCKLLLPFIEDPSESFVHGFEAGKIWAELSNKIEPSADLPVHTANVQLIRRMAVLHGYIATFKPWEGGSMWSFVKFEKKSHLTVIDNDPK